MYCNSSELHGRPDDTSIRHPSLTTTLRTPSVATLCLRKNGDPTHSNRSPEEGLDWVSTVQVGHRSGTTSNGLLFSIGKSDPVVFFFLNHQVSSAGSRIAFGRAPGKAPPAVQEAPTWTSPSEADSLVQPCRRVEGPGWVYPSYSL